MSLMTLGLVMVFASFIPEMTGTDKKSIREEIRKEIQLEKEKANKEKKNIL